MNQLAFVGVAHIHTPQFIKMVRERPGVGVKSVWDPNPARATPRAAELNAAVVTDPSQIWSDREVDAVVICSETHRHPDLVRAAAASGKHLFVEKPLGVTADESYAMADAITRAGVVFQTGYFRRSDPIHRFLKSEIGNGHFGRITRARASNCHSGALGGWFDAKPDDPANDWRWMADPKQAGVGAFGDLGTHSLDILLWLLGDVDSVTASLDAGTNRYDGCDETGEALLRFKSGTLATLAAAWDDLANPASLVISGTEAHAAVLNDKLFYTCKRVAGADGKSPWTDLPEALPHAFQLFLDAVAGDRGAPLVTPAEAAYRSAVMHAIYDGAARHAWVTPSGR
jgi:predicted dehydrogenase